jgi:hypothetical protein
MQMSSDIKTWLREAASRHNNYRCDEAADRIEALEKALREIGEKLTPDKYDNEHCLETVCGELARAALEDKE